MSISISLKIPVWLRLLNVIFGIFLVILSGYVVLNPGIALLSLLVFFILILLISGIIRIINGIFDRHLSKKIRIISLTIGIVLIGVALIVWNYPLFGVDLLIYLLAFGLILQGIGRIAVGGGDTYLKGWFRGLLMTLGVISILLAGLVLLAPNLGQIMLVFLLAWGFLISGIGRIATGFSGYMIVDSF
jgi:uncharacterized membrane protein HdeD (DUF308 family)